MSNKYQTAYNLLIKLSKEEYVIGEDNGRATCEFSISSPNRFKLELLKFIADLDRHIQEIYINNEIKDKEEVSDYIEGAKKIFFEVRFNTNDCFFTDIDQAKKRYINNPNNFQKGLVLSPSLTLIAENENNIPEWEQFIIAYEAIKQSLDIVKTLAHCNYGNESIFIDTTSTYIPSITINTVLSNIYDKNSAIFDLDLDISFLKDISNNINKKNIRYLKELAIFRSSLFDFYGSRLNHDNSIDNTVYLLKNINILKDTYVQNFQAYVSGLSINKLKTELASKQQELREQVTKGLMDLTGKMFAIPAIIGIAKLITDESSSYIASALIIVTSIILILSIVTQLKIIGGIKLSKDISFSDIELNINQITDGDIKETVKKIDKKLSDTIKLVYVTLYFYLIVTILAIGYSASSYEPITKFISNCFKVIGT